MLLLRRRAFARAGLVGNPSDGFRGKTISLIVRNYCAEVVLYEWDDVEIILSDDDRSRFRSVHDLNRDVAMHGYYGGARLIKATIKKFVDYCERMGHQLDGRNFAVRYSSNIPRQVGMAGSSAIIIATLRCLMDFYQVGIDLRVQPSLALSVEKEELGIAAGLQDRVVQVFEGLAAMDFSDMQTIDGYECGRYELLDPHLLPPLYIAFHSDLSEPTEVLHNDLRIRYERGDANVIQAMKELASLTDRARQSLEQRDYDGLSQILNRNFDVRRSICRLNPGHVEMVERARRAGASAKYSGSGGAIIGTYSSPEVLERLKTEMAAMHCRVIRPIVSNEDDAPDNATQIARP
jgi:glucuronokinase